MTFEGALLQVFYLPEVPSPLMTPYSPGVPTLHCIRSYMYSYILIPSGKGVQGRANQREG
jgi:hypothetical protein